MLTGTIRRFPVAAVAATMFIIQGGSVIVLALAGASRAGALAFVLLFGLGFGIGTVARPALLAHTFGVARYATVSGRMALLITSATTLGPRARIGCRGAAAGAGRD